MNTDLEVKKLDTDLKAGAWLQVWASKPVWFDKVTNEPRGWDVIIEHQGQLSWIKCYHKSLTERGLHNVEITKNTRGERTIRPWGK